MRLCLHAFDLSLILADDVLEQSFDLTAWQLIQPGQYKLDTLWCHLDVGSDLVIHTAPQ